jgi:1,4-alpha-glucan branching enzyme
VTDTAATGVRARLRGARLHAPHALLGPHREGMEHVYRVWQPHASAVDILLADGRAPMHALGDGLFEWRGPAAPPAPARLVVHRGEHAADVVDPYAFAPTLTAFELHLFNAGRLIEAWRTLGPQDQVRDGVAGVRFAVWAPNAERVSVVGPFNDWDGRVHPMQVHGSSGVWELFLPGVAAGTPYKYEIRNRTTGELRLKSDPFGRAFELRPDTASVIPTASRHVWRDDAWMAARAERDWLHAPMHVYEVHAGSWMRHPDGRVYDWAELARRLVPYVRDLGCTHIELLPITEHPLDESWGYQCTGFFAPSRRFGDADGLRAFVDAAHRAGLGVLLDWVPGHFPADDFALARFDGTALFEHADPRLGRHPDWGTHVFNYGRPEVRSFLLASACHWLEEFHFDGLRVDAVASMLYLDYSRAPGEWVPNRHGGRENLDAIAFLRELNTVVHARHPGAVTIAEESTAWPMVSRPVEPGGLGFSMKWNMGWMHDTLDYLRQDPVHRRHHHRLLTFGQLYAYTENFVLPFSHDEVVHGKGSLVGKMPGDPWQQFANVRLLFAWQAAYPGKKLAFMGDEFAQGREWSEARELDWAQRDVSWHAGVFALFRDLARAYRDLPALHDLDFDPAGFGWIDCDDADHSIVSFVRRARDGAFVVVVLNFTPVPRAGYRLGVPPAGAYGVRINTDSRHYGGGDVGEPGPLLPQPVAAMGHADSLVLTLPPLAALILEPLPAR